MLTGGAEGDLWAHICYPAVSTTPLCTFKGGERPLSFWPSAHGILSLPPLESNNVSFTLCIYLAFSYAVFLVLVYVSIQYSCLENPMDRGAWRATVWGFAKSWTWPSTHTWHQRESIVAARWLSPQLPSQARTRPASCALGFYLESDCLAPTPTGEPCSWPLSLSFPICKWQIMIVPTPLRMQD